MQYQIYPDATSLSTVFLSFLFNSWHPRALPCQVFDRAYDNEDELLQSMADDDFRSKVKDLFQRNQDAEAELQQLREQVSLERIYLRILVRFLVSARVRPTMFHVRSLRNGRDRTERRRHSWSKLRWRWRAHENKSLCSTRSTTKRKSW